MARMPSIAFLALTTLSFGWHAEANDRSLSINEPPASSASAERPRRSFPVRIVQRDAQSARNLSTAARRGQPIPLAPPSEQSESNRRLPEAASSGGTLSVVLSSLAIVLGLFFGVVWLARRTMPKASQSLPKEVLEILGRAPLTARQTVQLVRVGSRLLLLSVTSEGARTLAEISDPQEVEHLAGLCQQNQPVSISASFRQVLHQLGSQPERREMATEAMRQGI